MFKNLLNGLLSAVAVKLLDNYRQLSIQLLKIEAAKAYLHGVKMARLSAVGLICMGLTIGLIFLGLILLHISLFILLPWSLETKAVLGAFLGIAYLITGGFILRAAMDERTWMNKSGASEFLNKALHSKHKD